MASMLKPHGNQWTRWLCVLALLLCQPLLLASRSHAAEVRDIRLWRAPDHTRVVLDLTGPVEHSLLELKNPQRLVVDVRDVQLLDGLADLPLEDTPIRRVRSGVREGNDLRLVFDLQAAVNPRSFALAPNDRTGHRLVIDLFDENAAEKQRATIKSVEQLAERRDIVIAIDAGHGGEDPGALGPGKRQEKKVVLAIAEKLKQRLEALPGFQPVLIRTGDYYITHAGRRDLARKYQADLFVSIHADAFRLPSASGASVYALSTRGASSTTARYLADRANAADLVGGISLADKDDVLAGVLTDLSMTATLDTSLSLGAEVLREMGDITKLHKRQVEQAAFLVLKSPDIPSILVETGFISNPDEARKLSDPAYQQRMARAIQRGIEAWFTTHPPAGTLLAYQRAQRGQEYVIARGDTLSGIAERFSVTVRSIKDSNGLSSNTIRVGQTIIIPGA